jgi:arsenate reductase
METASEVKCILVLCDDNSCRTQIAEGYLRHFAGARAKVYSAGAESHGVNPKAIQVMAEDHIDISAQTSNNVSEYLSIPFDYIISVCENTQEHFPNFSARAERFHCGFPDPTETAGTEEEVMEEFRRVRDMIKVYSADFVNRYLV